MNAKADELWKEIEKHAEWIGVGKSAYKSDMFVLLALILAYYKALGTEPVAMATSPTMEAKIRDMLKDEPPEAG